VPADAHGESGSLEHVLGVVRRRKWWIVQAVVIVPLLAFLLTSRQEKEYTATAGLLFRDPPQSILNASVSDPTRDAATNAALVVLPAVAERAATLTGGEISAPEIAASVSVNPSGDSSVVDISATSPSPVRAAEMANAYGEAYISFRSDLDKEQLRGAITSLQAKLDALTPEEQQNSAGQSLQTQLDQLQLADSLANGNANLVQRATPPTGPSSPKTKRNVALGVVLGLLIGLGLAFARDRFDQTVRSAEELEPLYAAPLVGRIPADRRIGDTGQRSDASAEAFRALRANLRYFGVTRELRSILVSSPMSGDGKSTVAAGLAATMAAMGDHVVLVEADMHKAGMFNDEEAPGLSSVLTGSPLHAALTTLDLPSTHPEEPRRQLSVLRPGPLPPNPAELLESERMQELLEGLEDSFDTVVIDSPALTQASDARALVGGVSGVLIVSAEGQTRRDTAIEFRKQLTLLGATVLGVVANRATGEQYAYYGSRSRRDRSA